jgi:hypothetical protein
LWGNLERIKETQKMVNEKLQEIANRMKFDWQMTVRDEDEIRHYAREFGYSFETAEQLVFDLYLENFNEKGKTNLNWYNWVDNTVADMNIENELEELDYQMIWGYINQSIDRIIEKNKPFDAVGLYMAEKIENF